MFNELLVVWVLRLVCWWLRCCSFDMVACSAFGLIGALFCGLLLFAYLELLLLLWFDGWFWVSVWCFNDIVSLGLLIYLLYCVFGVC